MKIALLIASAAGSGIIGQEAAPALPPWATWGVLGLVIAGFVTKQLVPGWMYSDLKTEIKEVRADNTRLVELNFDTQKATLPAIEASTSVVSEAIAEIRSRKAQ